MRFFTEPEYELSNPTKSFLEFSALQTEKTALFNQWICANESLLLFLKGKSTRPFTDTGLITKHAFLSEFQEYIVHFFPNFESSEDDFWIFLTYYCSFLSLLPKEKVIEKQYLIGVQIKSINEKEFPLLDGNISDFHSQSLNYVSAEKTACYASFPTEWGLLKIQFVESTMALIKLEICDLSLAKMLVQQIKGLHPTTATLDSLSLLLSKKKKPELKNQSKALSLKYKLKSALWISGAVALPLVLWAAKSYFWDAQDTNFMASPKSSLVFFTPTERRKIDGYLKSTSPSLATIHTTKGGTFHTIRSAFTNTSAERIYSQLLNGLDSYYYNMTPFKDSSKANHIENTKELKTLRGPSRVVFKNNAASHVLILVFKDEPSTAVYSNLLKTKDTVTVQMFPGMKALFLPGREFYNDTALVFRQWDFNYDQALQNVYNFEGGRRTTVLFKGELGWEFNFSSSRNAFQLIQ